MKRILVRYKVKSADVHENERLIKKVYQELHAAAIDGFHYATFKLADGISFVHVAFSDTEEANSKFNQLPAFKDFQANIKSRCDEFPVVTPLTEIGSYNFVFTS